MRLSLSSLTLITLLMSGILPSWAAKNSKENRSQEYNLRQKVLINNHKKKISSLSKKAKQSLMNKSKTGATLNNGERNTGKVSSNNKKQTLLSAIQEYAPDVMGEIGAYLSTEDARNLLKTHGNAHLFVNKSGVVSDNTRSPFSQMLFQRRHDLVTLQQYLADQRLPSAAVLLSDEKTESTEKMLRQAFLPEQANVLMLLLNYPGMQNLKNTSIVFSIDFTFRNWKTMNNDNKIGFQTWLNKYKDWVGTLCCHRNMPKTASIEMKNHLKKLRDYGAYQKDKLPNPSHIEISQSNKKWKSQYSEWKHDVFKKTKLQGVRDNNSRSQKVRISAGKELNEWYFQNGKTIDLLHVRDNKSMFQKVRISAGICLNALKLNDDNGTTFLKDVLNDEKMYLKVRIDAGENLICRYSYDQNDGDILQIMNNKKMFPTVRMHALHRLILCEPMRIFYQLIFGIASWK